MRVIEQEKRNVKIKEYYKKRLKETKGKHITAIVLEISEIAEYGYLSVQQIWNILQNKSFSKTTKSIDIAE